MISEVIFRKNHLKIHAIQEISEFWAYFWDDFYEKSSRNQVFYVLFCFVIIFLAMNTTYMLFFGKLNPNQFWDPGPRIFWKIDN